MSAAIAELKEPYRRPMMSSAHCVHCRVFSHISKSIALGTICHIFSLSAYARYDKCNVLYGGMGKNSAKRHPYMLGRSTY